MVILLKNCWGRGAGADGGRGNSLSTHPGALKAKIYDSKEFWFGGASLSGPQFLHHQDGWKVMGTLQLPSAQPTGLPRSKQRS